MQYSGSGIQCLFTSGSGIRNRFFPDPGSQTHIFESLVSFLWVKYTIVLCKLAQIFFFSSSNKIIFSLVIFVATKKGRTANIYPLHHLLLLLDPGSEIRDLGFGIDKNQDPETSRITAFFMSKRPDPGRKIRTVSWKSFRIRICKPNKFQNRIHNTTQILIFFSLEEYGVHNK